VCSGSVGVSESEDSQTTWKVEEVEEIRDGGNEAKGGIIYQKTTARKFLQARGNSCVMAYEAGRHGQPLQARTIIQWKSSWNQQGLITLA
jgi:hypothetical protein